MSILESREQLKRFQTLANKRAPAVPRIENITEKQHQSINSDTFQHDELSQLQHEIESQKISTPTQNKNDKRYGPNDGGHYITGKDNTDVNYDKLKDSYLRFDGKKQTSIHSSRNNSSYSIKEDEENDYGSSYYGYDGNSSRISGGGGIDSVLSNEPNCVVSVSSIRSSYQRRKRELGGKASSRILNGPYHKSSSSSSMENSSINEDDSYSHVNNNNVNNQVGTWQSKYLRLYPTAQVCSSQL
jgi:hypothetical protein